jgi:hypothetical protein
MPLNFNFLDTDYKMYDKDGNVIIDGIEKHKQGSEQERLNAWTNLRELVQKGSIEPVWMPVNGGFICPCCGALIPGIISGWDTREHHERYHKTVLCDWDWYIDDA